MWLKMYSVLGKVIDMLSMALKKQTKIPIVMEMRLLLERPENKQNI